MTKETGGTAFPLFDGSATYGGLTKREWFAGEALKTIATLLVDIKVETKELNGDNFPQNIAGAAYEIADAMIAEGKK